MRFGHCRTGAPRGRWQRLPRVLSGWRIMVIQALLASALTVPLSMAHTSSAAAPGAATPELVLSSSSGLELLRLNLAIEARWTLAWRHSVSGTPVSDTFEWRDGSILLIEHRTQHLDIAGLGLTPGRGRVEEDGTGGFVVLGIDEPIYGNVHHLIIGSERTEMVLLHHGHTYPLSDTLAGVRVRIEVSAP